MRWGVDRDRVIVVFPAGRRTVSLYHRKSNPLFPAGAQQARQRRETCTRSSCRGPFAQRDYVRAPRAAVRSSFPTVAVDAQKPDRAGPIWSCRQGGTMNREASGARHARLHDLRRTPRRA